MPIRRLTVHACVAGVMLSSSTLVRADVSPWDGSYVAEGTCFCSGTQSREIDSLIVPTPVGGQSVAQVCERVGSGPILQKVNGKFNYTVFEDAQCGNGPFDNANSHADQSCIGHLGVSGEDCSSKGPEWALADAYAKPANVQLGISDAPAVTGGSRYITPPVNQAAEAQSVDVIAESADTPVAEIAAVRDNAIEVVKVEPKANRKPVIVKAAPETREQIRARQLEQLAAARERASLQPSDNVVVSVAVAEQPAAITPTEDQLPETVVESVETLKPASSVSSTDTSVTAPVAAFKVPTLQNTNSHDFDYFESAPVAYDYGGAGLSVAVSKSSHNRMQFQLSAAAAETYREVAIGVGMYLTPADAERLTVMVKGGLEYGKFSFKRDQLEANLSEAGAFVHLATRYAVTQKFKLQAGVGYSSFFEGDAVGFASAFYQLTSKLDLTAKAEAGDNDLLGFGLRYHY